MVKTSITRQCVAVIITALCILLAIVYPQTASAINLKHNSVVTDDTLTLGDIFHGLPHSEEKVLGAAPRPGSEMVLNARTLMRIALAMDLAWRPQNSAEYIVVSRAATLIERDTLESAIKSKLKSEGVTGNYKLLIPNEMAEIVLPEDQPAEIVITDVKVKHDRNWFEASVVAPSVENPIYRSRITGSIQKMVNVPVLKSPLRSGSIIGKHDIETITIPEKSLPQNIALNASELIGTTPRRMLSSGEPVKINEIEAPKLVERGDAITMTFKRGALELTAKGKALENGAIGDTIRVVNTGSKKTLEAIVTASQEVSIQSF